MADRRGTLWRAIPWWAGTTLALACAAAPARARWDVPAGCPGQAALQAEVEALIGRPLAADEAIAIDAEVRQEGAATWVLEVRGADGEVERTLEGESCAALLDAAALLVAWHLDPAAASQPAPAPEPEPAPAPVPELPSPDRASRLAPPDIAPQLTGTTSLSVGIGAAFVLDAGTLPALSPGVIGELVVRVDRLDLRARGGWLATQGARLSNELVSDAGIDVEWAGGSLHACGRPLDGDADARPGLAICGGVHAGALIARGVGVSDPGGAAAPLVAVSASASMPWSPVPALDLEVGLELTVPLGAPTFELAPLGDVFTPAPIAGRLTLGAHVDVR
jgi:hypothetical protein